MSDPLILSGEALAALASPAILARGMKYQREHRVLQLQRTETGLHARVEGNGEAPYQVVIEPDDDGELTCTCTCPFTFEPTCKHAVAVLVAWAHSVDQPPVVLDPAEEALEARRRRGAVEVSVKHKEGEGWYGRWAAWSLDRPGIAGRNVMVYSLTQPVNQCDCPDFAVNQLGTCKHIEAVMARVRTRKTFAAQVRRAPARVVVHLALTDTGELALHATAVGEAPDALHQRAAELVRAATPPTRAAVEKLLSRLAEEPTVVIHDTVRALGQRLARQEAADDRAARIRASLSGGRVPNVAAQLYPYQLDGVAFLAGHGRALLADDMGLGKTLQAIAAARWLMDHEGVQRVLVVSPSSVKHPWMREIGRFTGLEARVVDGSAPARSAIWRQRPTFAIASYETVVRDQEVIALRFQPDLIILDEAQRIRNWRTKTAAALKALPCSYTFVLTGTPLENRLDDLYSVLQMVDPHVFGPLWRFLADHHITDEKGKVIGYRNLTRLRARLGAVMLRRERSVVASQLPSRIDQQLDIELDRRQRVLHDGAVDIARNIAERAANERRPMSEPETRRFLAALQTARMAADAANLVDKEHPPGSPKLVELQRLFEEVCVEGGRKMVVFSTFRTMTDQIVTLAASLGLEPAYLHGGVPSKQRGRLIDRFQQDPACRVFISTDAGGSGLNLQAATVLVHVDLPWTPAVLDQRSARIHRLGQTEPVQIIRLVARGSYEERIGVLIMNKRSLFSNAVSSEGTEDVLGLNRGVVQAAMEALQGVERVETHDDASAPTTIADAMEAVIGDMALPAEPVVDAESAPLDAAAPDAALEAPPPLEVPPRPHPPREAPVEDAGAGVQHALAALSQRLGGRIRRILATAQGLCVVLDRLEEDLPSEADGIPIAFVDTATATALLRIGALGPGVQELKAPAPPAPWREQVDRRLRACGALLDADCAGDALLPASQALLGAITGPIGLSAPRGGELARWLHQEALPRGFVTSDETALLLGAQAMTGLEDVPSQLVRSLVEAAARRCQG